MHSKSFFMGRMTRIVEDACHRKNVALNIREILQTNFCRVDALWAILESKVSLLTPEERSLYESLKSASLSASARGNETNSMVEFLRGYNLSDTRTTRTRSCGNKKPWEKRKFPIRYIVLAALALAVVAFGYLYLNSSALLYNAVKKNNVTMSRFYLFLNADPNHVVDNSTAFLKAIVNQNEKLVDLLLSHGADPNFGSDTHSDIFDGNTPLMVAVWNPEPSLNILKKLIDAGGNPLYTDSEGRTLLFWTGNPEIAKYLVEKGVDVHHKSKKGQTSFESALEHHYGFVASAMAAAGADKSALYEKDENGDSRFQRAIKNRDYDEIRFCSQAGFDINEKVVDGETPLGWTLHQMEKEIQNIPNTVIVPSYVDNSAPLSGYSFGLSPPIQQEILERASNTLKSLGRLESRRYLSEKEKDTYRKILEKEKKDEIESDYKRIITLLSELGADINEVDEEGCTWLYKAVENYWHATTELLLDVGCDVNKPNNDGNTPLHAAAANRLVHISYQQNYRTGLGSPISNVQRTVISDIETVEWLLDHQAAIDARNNDQETPLHRAVLMNNLDVVQYLIDKRADVHAKDDSGMQPIHLASSRNTLDCLLQKGADPNAKDNKGQTPLFGIARNALIISLVNMSDEDEDPQLDMDEVALIVASLRDHGADMNIKDNEGNTPYDSCEEDFREILVQYGAVPTENDSE